MQQVRGAKQKRKLETKENRQEGAEPAGHVTHRLPVCRPGHMVDTEDGRFRRGEAGTGSIGRTRGSKRPGRRELRSPGRPPGGAARRRRSGGSVRRASSARCSGSAATRTADTQTHQVLVLDPNASAGLLPPRFKPRPLTSWMTPSEDVSIRGFFRGEDVGSCSAL